MCDDKKRILESALFISARSISIGEFMKLSGLAAPGFIKKILNELKEDYEKRGSSIEIIELDDEKWIMHLKDCCAERVKDFAQETELSKPALRTLAYIAKHDGILKSEVAHKISSQIYQDVKELIDTGFIEQTKAGRSKRLFLTNKFKQYFKFQKK